MNVPDALSKAAHDGNGLPSAIVAESLKSPAWVACWNVSAGKRITAVTLAVIGTEPSSRTAVKPDASTLLAPRAAPASGARVLGLPPRTKTWTPPLATPAPSVALQTAVALALPATATAATVAAPLSEPTPPRLTDPVDRIGAAPLPAAAVLLVPLVPPAPPERPGATPVLGVEFAAGPVALLATAAVFVPAVANAVTCSSCGCAAALALGVEVPLPPLDESGLALGPKLVPELAPELVPTAAAATATEVAVDPEDSTVPPVCKV